MPLITGLIFVSSPLTFLLCHYKNTNVIELYHLLNLKKDKNQLVFYNSGIGTYARPSWRFGITFAMQLISHKIDLAIAWYVFGRAAMGN